MRYGRPERLRLLPPKYRDRRALDVDGTRRTYWTAPASPPAVGGSDALGMREGATPPTSGSGSPGEGPPPLLIGLHGLNSSGSRLAWWSGLDRRGPAAGFHCVFPDAIGTVWDDHGAGRIDGADDAAFIVRLIEHLGETGVADPRRVVVAGVSSGATFGERLVRSGTIRPRGLALVCGGARIASTRATPLSANGVGLMLIAGTEDPIAPYVGGASTNAVGRLAMKQVTAHLRDPSGHESVALELLAAEWVAANACGDPPTVQTLAPTHEGFPVHRLVWPPADPGGPTVTLYRITGGGHGWPSGKQYLPVSLLGRIPQGLDATGIVLRFAHAALAAPPLAAHGDPTPAL